VAEDAVKVVQAFEKNHQGGEIRASAEGTFLPIKEIDAKLEPRVRASWRWHIVYLRAFIDREMFKTRGKLEGQALQAAFRELTVIYHAEHAHSMPIRPPELDVVPISGPASTGP